MKTGSPPRFTRALAALQVLAIIQAHAAGAATVSPGTIAALPCSASDPGVRAAWNEAVGRVSMDPLFLIRAGEEVDSVLGSWRTEEENLRRSRELAETAVLDRARLLLDEAWGAYYGFDFGGALGLLDDALDVLTLPGGSEFRVRLAFELFVLRGMVRDALDDAGRLEEFRRAAALQPERNLPPEKYSPRIISLYEKARERLLRDETVPLEVTVTPPDASLWVDAAPVQAVGDAVGVHQGLHFVRAELVGYEPWGDVLEVTGYKPVSLQVTLVKTGPEGEPDRFFMGRIRAADGGYLSELARRLGVDYLLVPEDASDGLHAWLVDDDGKTLGYTVVLTPGSDPASASEPLAAFLDPVRLEWTVRDDGLNEQILLPEPHKPQVEEPGSKSKWGRYGLVIGTVLLLGTAASGGVGGTRVDLSW